MDCNNADDVTALIRERLVPGEEEEDGSASGDPGPAPDAADASRIGDDDRMCDVRTHLLYDLVVLVVVRSKSLMLIQLAREKKVFLFCSLSLRY